MSDALTLSRYRGDPADVFAELVRRPAWHADAACREHPEVAFFIEHGDTAEAARTVCSACLVRDECLAAALVDPLTDGVWGGTTVRERRALRVGRAA